MLKNRRKKEKETGKKSQKYYKKKYIYMKFAFKKIGSFFGKVIVGYKSEN